MKKVSIMLLLAIAVGCTNQPQTEAADNTGAETTANTDAETADIAGVEAAVEKFRQTMLNPDQATFEQLTLPQLTYGHSSGFIEDRETCIASMVTGKFKFLTLTFSEQTVELSGNTAIVRHRMYADTHDQGQEPGIASLHVMQVWQHSADGWQLLARQAVKIPPVTP